MLSLCVKKNFCLFNVYETELLLCYLRDLCIYDRVVYKKKIIVYGIYVMIWLFKSSIINKYYGNS